MSKKKENAKYYIIKNLNSGPRLYKKENFEKISLENINKEDIMEVVGLEKAANTLKKYEKEYRKNKSKNNLYYVGQIKNTIYIFNKNSYKKQSKKNKKMFKEILGYENACKYRNILNKEKKNMKNSHKKTDYKKSSKIVKNKNLKDINIYVDGSFRSQDNTFSYGFVFVKNDEILKSSSERIKSEKYLRFRNVWSELKAATYAVETAKKIGYSNINLYYDFQGIEIFLNKDYSRATSPFKVLKRQYQEEMFKYMKDVSVNFIKVKAHSGDKFNNYVDKLCKKATFA